MNQNPTCPDANASHPSAVPARTYHLVLDATSREELLAALRLADAAVAALDCPACADGTCPDPQHQPRVAPIRSWRQLTSEIGRLPASASIEPLIRFDPDACRTWLLDGVAEQAGIDDGFHTENLTIAAGLDELLSLLHDDPTQPAWQAAAYVHGVDIWRTADGDGVDGGGLLTVDLTYMGQRVRLASLHQGFDQFTADAATSGIDAAVEALGHVAATINREFSNFRHATAGGDHPAERNTDDSAMWTVVGVWVDDEPVPVAVIAGQHDVSGGDDFEHFPQGVWAQAVSADDDLSAEQSAVEAMRDDDAEGVDVDIQ